MKVVKMVIFAGISGSLTSMPVLAIPLDVTLTGGTPSHSFSTSPIVGTGFSIGEEDDHYEDIVPGSGGPANSISLAGVNSINATWNAPAGYMYVVNPPPSDIGGLSLDFEVEYGSPGQASSLGSVTSSSISVHTLYGTSPFGDNVTTSSQLDQVGLTLGALAEINPNSEPFAFNSITVSADFSGTGADTSLTETSGPSEIASFFGELFGLANYDGQADPGALLTLEPLPTASTPDDSSTLELAGLGLAGLLLFGRKAPLVKA